MYRAIVVLAVVINFLFFMAGTLLADNIPIGQLNFHKAGNLTEYHWFSYIPKTLDKNTTAYILISGQNGNLTNNDYDKLIDEAKNLANWKTSFADTYGYILLTPVIPRNKSPHVYSVSLDLNSFVEYNTNTYWNDSPTDPFFKRSDLKVNETIDQLTQSLKLQGYNVSNKVFIEGFSAGAMFAQRYALLHPDRVHAIAAGQSGGSLTLPSSLYNGIQMNWPVGVNDFSSLTGKDFDLKNYKNVAQFFYIGDQDNNNSTVYWTFKHGGLFSQEQIDFLNEKWGTTDPVRIKNQTDYMSNLGCNVTFKEYPGIGHDVTSEMIEDTFSFFEQFKTNNPPESPIFVSPDIKANFSDGSVVALSKKPVYLSISSSISTNYIGQDSELWIAASTPFGWFSYIDPTGWKPGISPYKQGALASLPSIEIFNTSLPKGDYTFYFAIDDNVDGIPDVTWLDSVSVQVFDVDFELPFSMPNVTIKVDGNAEDWTGISPVLNDPIGDSTVGTERDLKSLYLAKDADNIYWRIDTWTGNYPDAGMIISFEDTDNYEIKFEAWADGDGSFYERNGNSDYVFHFKGGQEYLRIGKTAEGKFPLSLFAGYNFNKVSVYYTDWNTGSGIADTVNSLNKGNSNL